jgi:putative ABC transport system permease protein
MIKNFIYILQRFKTSSAINILGLTAAFASFFIILIHVYFEYSFERCHPNVDRIYRLELKRREGNTAILPRPLTREVIQSSPHVLHGTLINPYISRFYFTVENRGQAEGYRETFVTCNTDVVQIFGFRMAEGSADCLKQPENVIIPKSMARRMFGDEPAVGKQITLTGNMWTKQDRGFLVVGGVYEDFPANTQLNNHIYTAISENDNTVNDWRSGNYLCYLLLDGDAGAPEEVMEHFNASFDFSILRDGDGSENISIHLRPLREIYFHNGDTAGQIVKSGNPAMPLILLTVGMLIVAIAIINYINFAMALAPRRMRSINTHKILGSTNAALQTNIVAESVIMSLLSFVLALVSVWLIYSSQPALFSRIDIHPLHNLTPLVLTGTVALVAGFVAGIRPAIYLTSVPPAMAIRGSFGLSPSGKRMRTALTGFQFFVSTVLVFCAFFLYRQNSFMQKYALGYDTEQIALVELPQSIIFDRQNSFVAALKDHPGIEDVAFAQQKFGASDGYRTWTANYGDENIWFYSLSVSWNFPEVMGIKAIDGRLPDESDVHEDCILYAVNKTLQKKYGMTPGELIDVLWMKKSDNPNSGRILGVVDDLKFASLRKQVDNMIFVFNDPYSWQPWSYIRIGAGADLREAVEHIRKTIAGIDATFPASVEFYDEVFDALYRQELNTGTIISLSGLIAVIIAIAGVFGMVMFECEYRRREIGVRKVMGSTGYGILLLFNRSYLAIFAAGFAMAVPAGYYALNRWLDNFAYRTALPWWGFALAGLPVLAVIVLTVSIQCYKAATQNPVKTLNVQ